VRSNSNCAACIDPCGGALPRLRPALVPVIPPSMEFRHTDLAPDNIERYKSQ